MRSRPATDAERPRSRWRPVVAALGALVVLTAGCGGDSTDGPAPATTAVVTTTLPPTTTTLPTTGTAGAREFTVDGSIFPPRSLIGADGPSGSGCEPGPGPLPDGVWFGFVDDHDAASVSFDLACFFFGDPATVAAADDGEESPPPNDYHIRNQVDTVRSVPVAPGATAWYVSVEGETRLESVPYVDWPPPEAVYTPCGEGFCPVWLYVNGGAVTELAEQFLP